MNTNETTKPPQVGGAALNEGLGTPIAFVDEHGNIVIVGFHAWNKASFVDSDRAFPASWKQLVIGVSNA